VQFQFLKGCYSLSFAVLFHFVRVPVMRTVIGTQLSITFTLILRRFFFLISLNFEFWC